MILKIFSFVFLLAVFAHQTFAQQAVLEGCTLRGKITDLLGNPLPLAKIQIEDKTKQTFEADIDKDGNYSIGGFSCGEVKATYRHRDFHVEVLEMNLLTNKIVNLGLRVGRITDTPVLKLKGKILDERKRAFAGAEVKITNILNERVSRSVMSSSSGSFELIILDVGKYIFEVIARNKKTYQFEISIDILRPQNIKLKDIILKP